MYNSLNDAELIDGLINGQEIAFKKIYVKYHRKIYGVALKFVKSEELSQEIVQEVFVKIWESRSKINKELSFTAFLFRITHNHIFNLLKRAAKEASIKKEILASMELATNITENAVISSEYEFLASNAIEQLPPQRKLIFKMCRNEGKSYEEVATLLGISKSTVKDHMAKSLKSIREYLYINTDASFGLILFITLFYLFLD